MGLEINTIITDENQKKYHVLKETMYQGKKYFLAKSFMNQVDVVFEEELEGLDIYIKKVISSELLGKLMDIFQDQ